MLSPGHSIPFLSADAGKRRTSGETDLGAAPHLGEGSRKGPARACAVLPAPSPWGGGTCHRPYSLCMEGKFVGGTSQASGPRGATAGGQRPPDPSPPPWDWLGEDK